MSLSCESNHKLHKFVFKSNDIFNLYVFVGSQWSRSWQSLELEKKSNWNSFLKTYHLSEVHPHQGEKKKKANKWFQVKALWDFTPPYQVTCLRSPKERCESGTVGVVIHHLSLVMVVHTLVSIIMCMNNNGVKEHHRGTTSTGFKQLGVSTNWF